jgi:hypothetical protein
MPACRHRPIAIDLTTADRSEAVIRGDEEVGVALYRRMRVEPCEELVQGSIGIADGGPRCVAIDARVEPVQAVSLIVLSAVRITRPKNDREGFGLALEPREDRSRRNVDEPLLLDGVRPQCPGRHKSPL